MSYYEDVLIHEGVGHDDDPPGRGSGRYGWGTGDNPFQHQFNLQSEVKKMRKQGFKDSEIAKALFGPNATTTTLKTEIAIFEKTERRIKTEKALKILDECNGNKLQAAKKMGVPPSSFYKLVDPALRDKNDIYFNTADYLRNKIDTEGKPLNISANTEYSLGVKKDTKDRAVAILEKEGYIKATALVDQQGQKGKKTTVTVLCPPGTEISERTYEDGTVRKYVNWKKTGIANIEEYSPDGGKTFWTPEYPASMSSKRVFIKYGDQGGSDMDGVIEIRKGVKDLSLGNSNYAQLRIMVDGDHYMKGMAIYSDDVPDGYDIVYNTNKKTGSSYEKVFKGCKANIDPKIVADHLGVSEDKVRKDVKSGALSIETVDDIKALGIKNASQYIDKENPFGASIKAGGQYKYTDSKGKEHLSPINKLTEEGDWDSWSRTLSSQFLSKQPQKIINQQLNLSLANRGAELDQIKNLTNPVIKKQLLEDFAQTCDVNARELYATGFKKQAFQVLLPVTKLKDTEIYAPNYPDGEKIALVRYPHAGQFEIPILTNNRKNAAAKSIMGNAIDAVGINANVAAKLSGADFDGDTALVIPMTTNRITIKSLPMTGAYAALKDFDPKIYQTDHKTITNQQKQIQMGIATNLIADMTVGGAGPSQIVRAVKHSMVVIDSLKHNLDWKKSYEDYDILQLKKDYQGVNEKGQAKGASTILTKASSEAHPPHRRVVNDTSIMTPSEKKAYARGEVVYRETGKTKTNWKTGKEELVRDTTSKMDLVSDAMDLVRDKNNMKEIAYANYANGLKQYANEARKEARSIKAYKINLEARKTYASEYRSLTEKLDRAKANSPKEAAAQIMAAQIISERFKSNPDWDYEHKQRERQRVINLTRSIVGAKKDKIVIEPNEWEAIQSRAISSSMVKSILANTDQEKFKQLATPRKSSNAGLSTAQINRAKALYASGMYTLAEIGDVLGFSASTISKAIKE